MMMVIAFSDMRLPLLLYKVLRLSSMACVLWEPGPTVSKEMEKRGRLCDHWPRSERRRAQQLSILTFKNGKMARETVRWRVSA